MGAGGTRQEVPCLGRDGSKAQDELTAESSVEDVRKALSTWLGKVHMEVSPPFNVGWYNSTRSETAGGTQQIEAPDDAVAFAVYSVPGYLDVVKENYARTKPTTKFVDGTTDEILDWLRSHLPQSLEPVVLNTDQGPPYYHIQTIGAVAGVDQHIEPDEFEDAEDDEWKEDLSDRLADTRDPKMWGTDPATRRKIFAVNVHPEWGGWYAYRALIVLPKLQSELQKPQPLNFVAKEDAVRMLTEYNLRHQECLWRDLTKDGHPPEKRYNPDEYFFFMETSGDKRKRFLELASSRMPAVPPPRLA